MDALTVKKEHNPLIDRWLIHTSCSPEGGEELSVRPLLQLHSHLQCLRYNLPWTFGRWTYTRGCGCLSCNQCFADNNCSYSCSSLFYSGPIPRCPIWIDISTDQRRGWRCAVNLAFDILRCFSQATLILSESWSVLRQCPQDLVAQHGCIQSDSLMLSCIDWHRFYKWSSNGHSISLSNQQTDRSDSATSATSQL